MVKRKLVLNRQTIRVLRHPELAGAAGGALNISDVWCQTMHGSCGSGCTGTCACPGGTGTCTGGFD